MKNIIILATTTVIGGVIQVTCRRYEKFHPEVENQGKKRAISKFLAKNGLVTGIGVGLSPIFFKEGIILLKGRLSLLNNNPKVVVVTKPKSFARVAISKDAILSFISGSFVGYIWLFRS